MHYFSLQNSIEMIDLRSDTITRPTAAMLETMMKARVGDDVFGEDPTINALQDRVADMFGHEAGLFCPSGTMTNQVAIRSHTRPGDDVICASVAHVYLYEGAGIARNSGASVRLLEGDRGRLNAEEVEAAIQPDDAHVPHTSLVCLEDTVNKGGGCTYDIENIKAIRKVCDQNDLQLHLDGARLFNALVETGYDKKEYGQLFDSISICFSKGLGCPVGSILVGSRGFIKESHRVRKSMGGGMRQAGFLAAACDYALDHHIERMSEDHERARKLGQMLLNLSAVDTIIPVETNIVIVQLKEGLRSDAVTNQLADAGLVGHTFGVDKVRFVTHLDFDDTQLEEARRIIEQFG